MGNLKITDFKKYLKNKNEEELMQEIKLTNSGE
jgi:hypothetical protein